MFLNLIRNFSITDISCSWLLFNSLLYFAMERSGQKSDQIRRDKARSGEKIDFEKIRHKTFL